MSVRCFSANCTVFSSTLRPLRRRTAFMYPKLISSESFPFISNLVKAVLFSIKSIYLSALFSESACSPKCSNSSSVVGTQNGSIGIIWNIFRFYRRLKQNLLTDFGQKICDMTQCDTNELSAEQPTSQCEKTSCGEANPLVRFLISLAKPKLSTTGSVACTWNRLVPSLISSDNTWNK